MIAVDSSALMAMVLGEPEAQVCSSAIQNADGVLISAATLTETFIVALRRRVSVQIHRLVSRMDPQIIPVDEATALRTEGIYHRFGKGFHKAALNFGDCFAYDVAREHGCPLLYVGNDFALTDIEAAV